MSKLRVHSFSISIDGFGAGPNQDFQNPPGVGGLKRETDPPAKLRTLTQPLPKGEETPGTDKTAPGNGCTPMKIAPDT